MESCIKWMTMQQPLYCLRNHCSLKSKLTLENFVHVLKTCSILARYYQASPMCVIFFLKINMQLIHSKGAAGDIKGDQPTEVGCKGYPCYKSVQGRLWTTLPLRRLRTEDYDGQRDSKGFILPGPEMMGVVRL